MRVFIPRDLASAVIRMLLHSTVGDVVDTSLPSELELVIDRGEGLETLRLRRSECDEPDPVSPDLWLASYSDVLDGTCYSLVIDSWNYPVDTPVRSVLEKEGFRLVLLRTEDDEELELVSTR